MLPENGTLSEIKSRIQTVMLCAFKKLKKDNFDVAFVRDPASCF